MKVVGTQGKTRWLLLVRPKVGRVLDLDANKLFPEFNLDSIIARGYWEDATLPDRKLQQLLDGVVGGPNEGCRHWRITEWARLGTHY